MYVDADAFFSLSFVETAIKYLIFVINCEVGSLRTLDLCLRGRRGGGSDIMDIRTIFFP